MTPENRARALDATSRSLVSLTEDRDRLPCRWRMTMQVLTDGRLTVELQTGRSDETGRAPRGGHSDPTGRAATTITAAVEQTAPVRAQLLALERTIAECARWLRGTISGEPWPGPDSLHAAVADVAWLRLHHRPILTALDPGSGLLADVDDAITTLHRSAQAAERISHTVRADAHHVPPMVQPAAPPCRAHERWRVAEQRASGRAIAPVPSTRHGLCDKCWKFRDNHKVDPSPEIIRRHDYGQPATPEQILRARTAARTSRGRRKR